MSPLNTGLRCSEPRIGPPLWAMARWNRPFDRGLNSSRETEREPADWPKSVTFPGSPPNATMFRWTQRKAAIWSSRP